MLQTLPARGSGRFGQTTFALVSRKLGLGIEKSAAGGASEVIRLGTGKATGDRMIRIITESTVDSFCTRTRAEFRPRGGELFDRRVLPRFVRSLQPFYILACVLNLLVARIGVLSSCCFVRIRRIGFWKVWSIGFHFTSSTWEITMERCR